MRIAFAVFLFIHAAAHGVGFLSQTFRIGGDDAPGAPAFLLSGLDPGHWLLRLLGVVWLGVGIAFVAAGVGVLKEADWTMSILVAALILSTLMSLMWVKDAPFGLVANAIVLIVLLVPALHDRVFPV
ncbi:MAG: hypothetical protein ABFS21_00535 [Actinomycetota bacterium]